MATRSTKPSAMTTSYAMQSILTDVVSAGTEAPLGYGLGYSIFYYYCASNAVLDTEQYIKLLSGDGIAPTEETIADGSYPLPMSSCARTLRPICLPDGSLRSCSPKTASAVFETPAMAHSNKNKRGSTIRCFPLPCLFPAFGLALPRQADFLPPLPAGCCPQYAYRSLWY